MARSPKSYQRVFERLTRLPLAQAEQRITMENKSYDLQVSKMQASRSRMPMSYSKSGITNLPGPLQLKGDKK